MTKNDMKTKMYTIDADNVSKAELKARKKYADEYGYKSIRSINAFGIRVS
jgi:hypothetical protein